MAMQEEGFMGDNSIKCRDYYRRTKQDPEKLAALRARRTRNQRRRRAASRAEQVNQRVKQSDHVKQAEIPVELL